MIPKVFKDADTARLIEDVNDVIDQVNTLSSSLSLKQNFNCQIIEVVFAAGEEKVISHKLGIRPKHRLILNQEGNGVLSDTPSGWNQNSILIKNNGAAQVKATIMLVRE